MECDTSDKSAGRKCGFQSLLHGYTNKTPLALRACWKNCARAIGNLFERHDAHRNPKNIQTTEVSQTEGRMGESDKRAQAGTLLNPKCEGWAVPPKASRRR